MALTKAQLKALVDANIRTGNADTTASEARALFKEMIDAIPTASGGTSVEVVNSLEADGSGAFQLVGDEATPSNSEYYGTDATGAKGFHALPTAPELGDKFVWDTIPLQPATFTAGGASGHQRLLEGNNLNYSFWALPDGTEIVHVSVILHAPPSATPSINLHWGDATDKIFASDLQLPTAGVYYQVEGVGLNSDMVEIPYDDGSNSGSKKTSPIDYTAFKRLELVNITAIEEVAGTMKILFKLP